jgi:hypothetical protein
MCQADVGCRDDSPGKDATARHVETAHPIVRLFESGDLVLVLPDELMFDLAVPAAPGTPDLRRHRSRRTTADAMTLLLALERRGDDGQSDRFRRRHELEQGPPRARETGIHGQ